jgi:hypothetical protein
MKKFLLLLFCLAIFVPYFARPFLVGYDSFYYLTPSLVENEPVLAFLVFNAINGNVLLAKCALFLCLLGSVASIALLGRLFSPKNGWKAGFLVFLSPIFIFEVLNFEGEQFAYPLLFLSLYFLFKNGFQNKIIACCLVLFASLFWQGSLVYLAVYSIYFLPALIPLFFYFTGSFQRIRNVLGNFLPKWDVQESAFLGAGITFHWGLLLGILGFFEKKAQKLLPAMVFFGIIAFLNAKFAIHLAPLLAVGLAVALEGKYKRLEGIVLGLLIAIVAIAIIFVIPFVYEPTQIQIEQVQIAVSAANGKIIYNDWTFGNMINYFSGKALARAGGIQPDLNCHNCIVLTNKQMPDCINQRKGQQPFVYYC